MQTSPAGVNLIKEFEGFRANAYVCPAGVWTIGYGHTANVKPGDYVSKKVGEEYLRDDLVYFEAAVKDLIEAKLSQLQFDALVSFSFNCGAGALGGSTMRKRLNAGENVCKVLKEELPKWVKGDGETLPGLVRRREAEIEHACGAVTEEVEPHRDIESYLETAAWHYASEDHQKLAWRFLEANVEPAVLEEFKKLYQFKVEKDILVTPQIPVFPLDVPYYYQRDSKTGHGERMCFTSSMAMALDYIDSEVIQGDDDWYLQVVLSFGDTVSAEAQLAAAHSLGFDAEFSTNGTQAKLEALLDAGVPVPVGILHKGGIEAPSGGGHWICLVGHDETHFDVHDPFGELDLLNGGYCATGPEDGKFQRYTKKNLMKRWLIANDSDGWYMDLTQE